MYMFCISAKEIGTNSVDLAKHMYTDILTRTHTHLLLKGEHENVYRKISQSIMKVLYYNVLATCMHILLNITCIRKLLFVF